MNTSRNIGSPHPHITKNREGRWYIFYLVRRNLDLVYREYMWHGTAKSESENLGGNKCFENAERPNILKLKKMGEKIL